MLLFQKNGEPTNTDTNTTRSCLFNSSKNNTIPYYNQLIDIMGVSYYGSNIYEYDPIAGHIKQALD